MWFSSRRSTRSEGRRRRLSHATVVAYVALIIAVLGVPAAGAASFLVHTRNIANGAVTTPKIRVGAVGTHRIRPGAVGTARIHNRAVTRPKIHDHAVNGRKVANNSLTGTQINESTLRLTRIVHQVGGTATAPAPRASIDYPLPQGNPYHQPAHTADLYFGTFRVRFPADCTGDRYVRMFVLANNRVISHGIILDSSAGELTENAILAVGYRGSGGELFTPVAVQRHLTAQIEGYCSNSADVHPSVLSATIHVVRYR